MWLRKLKIAIIEKDIEKINSLMDNLPSLSEKNEIDEALHLLSAATSLVTLLRDETQTSMIQMQKNITFLKSTQAPATGKLDISS